MRSLAALVLLPLLAEATGGKNDRSCESDSCLRAVNKPEANRKADCQSFLGTTTVTAAPHVVTAYVTALATDLVDVDVTESVTAPFTQVDSAQVTNTLTSYVATITGADAAQASEYFKDEASTSIGDGADLQNRDVSKLRNRLKTSGGYPMYAILCLDKERYASACKCIGVNTLTVTAPGPVSTKVLTVTQTAGTKTAVDKNTATGVVTTIVVTKTVTEVCQDTQTVAYSEQPSGSASTDVPASDSALPTDSQSTQTRVANTDVPATDSALPTDSQSTQTGVTNTDVPATDSALPTDSQSTQTGVTTMAAPSTDSAMPTDSASVTGASRSLSSAQASDFPTSIIGSNSTMTSYTTGPTATSVPPTVGQSFRLKVPSGPLANNSYLTIRPWKDLGAKNGGEAYLITFAPGQGSLWTMGGNNGTNIYSLDDNAKGKVVVASGGMDSRLAVAAPGAGAAYIASELLQCTMDASNLVSCQEGGVYGAPYNRLGNCDDTLAIFKDTNACSGGTLFSLMAEYV